MLAASSVRNAAAVWARGLWVGNGARVNAGGAAYPTVAASYGRRNLHSTRYGKNFFPFFDGVVSLCR